MKLFGNKIRRTIAVLRGDPTEELTSIFINQVLNSLISIFTEDPTYSLCIGESR